MSEVEDLFGTLLKKPKHLHTWRVFVPGYRICDSCKVVEKI